MIGLTAIVLSSFALAPPAAQEKPKSAAAQKIDLYAEHADEYAAKKTPTIVTARSASYLAITGRGEPGGETFQRLVGTLYGVAYALKMRSKAGGRDYNIAPLEALWWGSTDTADFFDEPRDTWNWRILIRTPDFITTEDLREVVGSVNKRGKQPGREVIELLRFAEGECVQALHVGPYATEPDTIRAMVSHARELGLRPHGLHHEIYLSDPSRTPPEKLRTILRLPVKRR